MDIRTLFDSDSDDSSLGEGALPSPGLGSSIHPNSNLVGTVESAPEPHSQLIDGDPVGGVSACVDNISLLLGVADRLIGATRNLVGSTPTDLGKVFCHGDY